MTAKAIPALGKNPNEANWSVIWDGAQFALDSFGSESTHVYPEYISTGAGASSFASDWEKLGGDLFAAMVKYEKAHGPCVICKWKPK